MGMTFRQLFDRETVAFTTPGVDRIFVACERCKRVMPHYKVYPPLDERGWSRCPCGHAIYRYVHLPEWKAAWWVLRSYVWRHLWQGKAQWDPRVPMRRKAAA